MKTVDQIRELFLSFFEEKDHKRLPSDSLVPQNDPTLLFTGAGMNQFKEYFLGIKKDLKRAATSQKCLRTGDLDEVGRTPYHHSFFEMLGNFSFGDYFKKEAVSWAWEFLTQRLGIPEDKLCVSVHKDDEEAYQIWKDKIGIPVKRIHKMGDKTNFWPANAPKDGPNGPCGPCSEIYFDQGEDPQNPHNCSIECGCGRFAEIWNLVFTQFDRRDGGKLVPLAQKNIDTGMGLERLACVLQDKKTNFEIDALEKINQAVEKFLGVRVESSLRKSLYAITDHLRASVMAIADGVAPSNEGRGYVIRKLIRRAIWQAREILVAADPGRKAHDISLHTVVSTIISVMSHAFPDLKNAEKNIIDVLRIEENSFLDNLESGREKLEKIIQKLRENNSDIIPAAESFKLHDTYGFPIDLIQSMAEKRGFKLDKVGFDKLMAQQQLRAKEASQISGEIFVTSDLEKKLAQLAPTRFLGYESLSAKGKVLYVYLEGRKGIIVLDQTPFYAESGGQVGDQGVLENKNFKAKVLDTQKKDKQFVHHLEVEKGLLKIGDELEARVDQTKREDAMRNHTATHLLHAALRKYLGAQVRQLGSLVSPEKLRFDYSYPTALTSQQIKDIEDLVNREIRKSTAVSKVEKPIEEAKREGAIAFFGEKYGDKVRVVTVENFSKELCGGTHCDNTGQIGFFVITSDSSIASGTRRIEALTGQGASDYVRTLRGQVGELAVQLKTSPADLPARIAKLQDSLKKLEKERQKGTPAALDPKEILKKAVAAGKSLKLAAYRDKGFEIDQLRNLSDTLKSSSSQTVYLLAAENEEKVHFILGMSGDLKKSAVDLQELWKEVGPILGASGGGRKDLVQAGSRNEGGLSEKWQKAVEKALKYLEDFKGV